MTIVYVSDYVTAHIRYFLNAVSELPNVKLYFIETQARNSADYFQQGFAYYIAQSEKCVENFEVVSFSASEETRKQSEKLISESDVVIIGNANDQAVLSRLRSGKLTFRAHERWYRKKLPLMKRPRAIVGGWLHHSRYKNLYLLCASGYTAFDASRAWCFRNKVYKWGYFPEIKRYEDFSKNTEQKKHLSSILWVARLIEWKHPELPVRIAGRLKSEGYKFDLKLIGTGELEDELRGMINDYDLQDCVHMLGSMKPEQVRLHMEASQIFLFTSDRNEGWGVVLNEAMNSGCAVVASHAIGAVPYLIKDGENGLIYMDGDEEDLYRKVKMLLDDSELCTFYGKSAYETVTDEWNAEVAAERFINLAEHILSGDSHPDLYASGPCSRAEIIKDDWYCKK